MVYFNTENTKIVGHLLKVQNSTSKKGKANDPKVPLLDSRLIIPPGEICLVQHYTK